MIIVHLYWLFRISYLFMFDVGSSFYLPHLTHSIFRGKTVISPMVAKFVIVLNRIYKALEQKSPQVPLPRTSTAPLLHPPPPPTAAGLGWRTARRSAGTIDRPRRPATGMSPRLIQSLVEFVCHRIVSSLRNQHFALVGRSASIDPRVGWGRRGAPGDDRGFSCVAYGCRRAPSILRRVESGRAHLLEVSGGPGEASCGLGPGTAKSFGSCSIRVTIPAPLVPGEFVIL